MQNCFVKSFKDILPICIDFYKGSSFAKRAAFSFSFKIWTDKRVCSCKVKIDVYICCDEDIKFFRLTLSFQFIKELKMKLLVLLKKQKKDCVLSIRRKLKNVKWARLVCNLIVSEQERASVFAFLFYKRNKKTCSSGIVELYKHLGIIKNTREVREALACGSCFSITSLVFLKIPASLYIKPETHKGFLIKLNNVLGDVLDLANAPPTMV